VLLRRGEKGLKGEVSSGETKGRGEVCCCTKAPLTAEVERALLWWRLTHAPFRGRIDRSLYAKHRLNTPRPLSGELMLTLEQAPHLSEQAVMGSACEVAVTHKGGV
jgi:hypothetical protein